MPHELGHAWYRQAFWNGAPRAPTDRYGSAAPDWMDEAAAILLEDERRADAYRARFADSRRADPASDEAVPPEIPLTEFLTMAHPISASLPTAGREGPIQLFGKPTLFYNESRVFIDYLAERSGNPRIFAAASEGARRLGGFDRWLASEGPSHRLPADVARMETDWRRWLDIRYPSR